MWETEPIFSLMLVCLHLFFFFFNIIIWKYTIILEWISSFLFFSPLLNFLYIEVSHPYHYKVKKQGTIYEIALAVKFQVEQYLVENLSC